MKKNNFLRIIIFAFLTLICWFTYEKYFKKTVVEVPKAINNNEESVYNSNIIKDIKYTSEDLKGNQYIIISKQGEIDLTNSNIIYLTDVTAFIKLIKNSETIKITSNYGKYNTTNYDTIFSKDVKINYIDNIITGEYLDFSMGSDLLIISRDVVYKNLDNILKADVIELNTITKDTKVFMHNSNKKIKIKSVN